MPSEQLRIHARPQLDRPQMVMGFTGWMNGGEVSIGTVETLIRSLRAELLAEISPSSFYIYNFPGPMEVSALFRPHVKIEEGLITELTYPPNAFHYDTASNLILFRGKEPNFGWDEYAECIFSVAEEFEVARIYFVGSVAGVVPHTREPRLFCSMSDGSMKDELERYGVRFSNYEGPGSMVTYLTHLAGPRGVQMASLVAEIPAYVQGTNPICIESVVRKLSGIFGLSLSLDELRPRSEAFERRLSEVVGERPDLLELVTKLEGDYDNEVFETQMSDLKEWLEEQGIRLD